MSRSKEPRSQQSRLYHHGSVANAALREAHRILANKGVEAVTVRAIALAVGVAPNALYRHFADKNALLARLAEQGFRELTRNFQTVRARNPKARLRAMASRYLMFGTTQPAVLRLMFEQDITKASKDSGLEQAAHEAFTALLEAAAAALKTPVQDKLSIQLAVLCWSLVHGYSTLSAKHAFDFIKVPHGIETLVRFIQLDNPSNGLLKR